MDTKTRGVSSNYAFPVVETDVFINKSGFVKVPGKKAIVRGDSDHVLSIVSDKYKVLPHAQVVEGFREALKGQTLQETIRVTKGGARLYVELTLPEVTVKVKQGDEVALKLIAVNSYDGSHVLQVMFGAFRLICSNGAIFGEKFINLEQRHVGGIGIHADSLAFQIAELTNKFRATLPFLQKMTATTLDADTKVFRGSLFMDDEVKLPEYILAQAWAEYTKEGDGSVWGWYNAYTKVITHQMRRESPAMQIAYGRIAWKKALDLIEA